MTNPDPAADPAILGHPETEESNQPSTPALEEKIQKALDKALYANGNPTAQKIRNFLNGTWLGEPLHVALTDVPIGAWTVAMVFDALDVTRNRDEFALAADTSIAIGLAGAAGAALTGLADWSDVDPPARRTGLIHALLNISATALFTTSLILRKRNARAGGRIASAFGYALVSYSAHLGGSMVYEDRVGVDRTPVKLFRKNLCRFWLNHNCRRMPPGVPITMACPFCSSSVENASLPLLKRALISAGRFQKASWRVTVLFVLTMPHAFLLRMAVC